MDNMLKIFLYLLLIIFLICLSYFITILFYYMLKYFINAILLQNEISEVDINIETEEENNIENESSYSDSPPNYNEIETNLNNILPEYSE